MKNFLVSLPKPSNIVAREPISSIEGLRRKVLQLGDTSRKGNLGTLTIVLSPPPCIQRWSPGGCLTLAAAWAFFMTGRKSSRSPATRNNQGRRQHFITVLVLPLAKSRPGLTRERQPGRPQPVRRSVEHQPTGPLRGPQDSERLTVPAVVPRAAEAVDVVWISVPHADEITGACDLEVDLDDGIWHRAPLAVDDFGEHSKPLPWQTEKFTCGLSWRDSGRGTGGARPRANRFYQRYKSPGVSLGDGEVADERLSKERGECLDRFGGSFKNDVAGFGMRERAVGDFVDPHQLAGVVVVGEGARWSWHGNVKCGCRIHSPKR
jgi:hypothetical protein